MAMVEGVDRLDLDEPAAFETETTPLLNQTLFENATINTGRPYVFAALAVFGSFVVFASMIVMVPDLEIYRYIACQSYYAGHGDADLIRLIGRFDGAVDERCMIDAISVKVAKFEGLVMFIESFFAVTVVLIYGKMADTYGRKVPLYITMAGAILGEIWYIFVVGKAGVWSINTLLLAPIISGVTGASPTIRTILFSVVCDCFTGSSRLVAMSYLFAVLLLTASVAPAAGSWLLSRGLLLPAWTGMGVYVAALVLLFFIPETHPQLMSQRKLAGETSMLTNDENMHAIPAGPSESIFVSCKTAILASLDSLKYFTHGRNYIILGVISFTFSFTNLIMLGKSTYVFRSLIDHCSRYAISKQEAGMVHDQHRLLLLRV